ncbi:MAG: hypothetical protein ACM31C_28195 [Acidobacteriota bacterium]
MRIGVLALALGGCGFHQGSSPVDATGPLDAPDAPPMIDAPDGGGSGCTMHTLPPSVNVNPGTWAASFLTAPVWSCTSGGTTTIDSTTGTVSSTSCDLGTPALANGVAQASAGPTVLVVRLRGLTVSNGHILKLVGDKPIVLLVAGPVEMTSGGIIDAGASGATPGPGGSPSACADQASGLGQAGSSGWGGGGGGFGTAGGQGGWNTTNGGNANGSIGLTPLRGGCAGGATPGSSMVGGGGGALEISAATTITIDTGSIVAASGGGGPATTGGGNGGGAGGGILLVAPALPSLGSSGVARANGGAGSSGDNASSGGGPNTAGQDGHLGDNNPATGGSGGDAGRSGGLAYIVGTGTLTTAPGSSTSPTQNGRGGGGGGGGRIVVTTWPTSTSCD